MAARLGNGWRIFIIASPLRRSYAESKEQLTKIVALHKLYVVLRTHSNIINFNLEDIRKTNSIYFTIISLFRVIVVGCFIWTNRVEP